LAILAKFRQGIDKIVVMCYNSFVIHCNSLVFLGEKNEYLEES